MKQSVFVKCTPYLFILIWASGYVVAKFGLPYAEPLTFLSMRYAGVIVMMAGLAIPARAPWPESPQKWLHIAIAGLLMHAAYLGGVWKAIGLGMPAGVAALIVNTQPILTAILSRSADDRVSGRQWAGLVLGFVGVILVVSNRVTTHGLSSVAIVLTVFALFSMTIGTLYQKRFCPSFDIRSGQVIQFSASLAVTLPLALALEHRPVMWTGDFMLAMAWSIFVLSGVGITLLFLMIRHGAATQVTSYFYLVPPVTAFLAWIMFDETFTPFSAVGMVLTVVAVALIVRPSGRRIREIASNEKIAT